MASSKRAMVGTKRAMIGTKRAMIALYELCLSRFFILIEKAVVNKIFSSYKNNKYKVIYRLKLVRKLLHVICFGKDSLLY